MQRTSTKDYNDPTQIDPSEDPANYSNESHEMENTFISWIDRTPPSDGSVIIFPFERRNSTFDLDEFNEDKYKHRLSLKQILRIIET